MIGGKAPFCHVQGLRSERASRKERIHHSLSEVEHPHGQRIEACKAREPGIKRSYVKHQLSRSKPYDEELLTNHVSNQSLDVRISGKLTEELFIDFGIHKVQFSRYLEHALQKRQIVRVQRNTYVATMRDANVVARKYTPRMLVQSRVVQFHPETQLLCQCRHSVDQCIIRRPSLRSLSRALAANGIDDTILVSQTNGSTVRQT